MKRSHLMQTGALDLESRLDPSTKLGVKRGKANSLINQVLEQKDRYPDDIILFRVGEFYHAYGVDAILLIEHARTTPERSDAQLQTCVHNKRIQSVLALLVQVGLRVAIFEESEVLKTPRERYLAQIVDDGAPVYVRAPDAYEYDVVEARPYGSVHQTPDGVSVCLVYIQERVCRVYHKVTQLSAQSLLSHAKEPILVCRTKPKWLAHAKVVFSGIDPHVSLLKRTLCHIQREYHIAPSEFEPVTVKNGRCNPLSTFTLNQLGLSHDAFGVPSLTAACLPIDAPSTARTQLKQWLGCPPDAQTADAIQVTLQTLVTDAQSIAPMRPARPGRRLQQIQGTPQGGAVFLEILSNADAYLNTDFAPLKAVIEASFGATKESVVCVKQTIEAFVSRDIEVVRDERGNCHDMKVFVRPDLLEMGAYHEANDRLRALLASYDSHQLVRDAKGISIHGKPNHHDKIAVPDKKNPNVHTTAALLAADLALRTAHDDIERQQLQVLAQCTLQLQRLQTPINVVETFALHLTTLWYHARSALHKQWQPCETGDGLRVKELTPYWMSDAIRNDVVLDNQIMVLTAPNGGGKSTLLRGLAAVALLAQCGLFAPCGAGSVVPRFASIFLRTGTMDCACERRSSFANEMVDLAAMLDTQGTVLMLVDEPCSNTRPSEGSRLLGSVLNNIAPTTLGILSTHLDDIQTTNLRVCWYKLDARLHEYDCVPDFVLTPGRCTDSMALRVAIASGLPLAIVKEVVHENDTESQMLAVVYGMGLTATRWQVGQLPSAMHQSVLYVLILDKTVYVGETDRLVRRFRTHVQEKKATTGYIVDVKSKSTARALESRMQSELTHYNVAIESLSDMCHDV